MELRLGTVRGLDACASAAGTFAVLALDHRDNLRRILAPDDPAAVSTDRMIEAKRAVVRAVGSAASGILLDPEVGAAQAIVEGSLPGATGLIVAIEATGFEGPPGARVSRVLPGWGVSQAKRLGADAVKLLLYYHPDAPNAADQERLLMQVAEDCTEADLPLFLEPLGFGLEEDGGRTTGEARRDLVVRTARRLTALGGDVLKAELPYDPSVTDPDRWQAACEELDEASGVPWVVLSAGVDGDAFEAQAAVACRAGASGVAAGRSVWADGITLPAGEREAWLATEGVSRMRRLAGLVDELGRPWRQRSSLGSQPTPAVDWYLDYPA